MFRNYLLIAFRKLWKNKALSFINIFGLATGMACTLMIFLFVQDELQYDRHHADADRIYRVVKDFINDDGSRIPDATTPGPLAGAMQEEMPEVESVTRLHPDWGNTNIVEYGDKKFTEAKIWRVDSSFFDVFSITLVKGNTKTALNDRKAVVMTETTAKRYFGEDEPIGKIIKLDGEDVTVTGIVRDVPAQSHIHYDFLMSYRRLPQNAHTNWGSYNYYTYVKVKSGTDIKAFEKKIQDVHDRNSSEHFSQFYTQPLLDIHLTSHLKWELEPNGDKVYVYIFSVIGIFILLIAAINYINLATARSSLRAKETGIRKVSGALRGSLVFQFLMESIILCSISAWLAIAIAWLVTPVVNDLTQKQLHIISNPVVFGYLIGVTVLIGLVAGLLPALYLSSFRPVAALKGLRLTESGALTLRKSLVVVQFTISIALIISTLIIVQQIDYLQTAKLGFNKDQVLVVRNARGLSRADQSSFLNSIKQLSGVEDAATSASILGQGFNTSRLRAVGSEQEQQLNFTNVGFGYMEVSGIEMVEGHGFTHEFPADTLNNGTFGGPLHQRLGGIVINERAVKEFNLGSPAVGKRLQWATDGDTLYYLEVVGVAKDFHFTSLRNEIKPYGFLLNPARQSNFTIRVSEGAIPATLTQLEDLWKRSFPERTFEYVFLNDSFAKLYVAEGRFQKVFISLVVLGIIIACLGLFALASFSAEQRVKEIGIRKVLGASVLHVITLLSKDFLRLVTISIVLAIPVAAYAMTGWLQGFAYHVSMEWWVFVVSAVIALVIAMLTISTQAFKAAIVNPTKSLRSE